jgi:MFS family permease
MRMERGQHNEGHPQRWTILAVLAAVAFMAQLDLFIVNVAIPALGRSFRGSDLAGLSWVLNGYAIVFAALLVPAGRLADHYGRRRFLLGGVALFITASAVRAVAPSLPVLIAGRVLQAAGAAAIVPTSLGLLLPVFPADHHSRVVGIWAGVAAVAATSGPPLGGLLVAVDWRWIFVVNVPIGIATMVVGYRVLPEIRAEKGAPLPDPVSMLAAVTLSILVLVQGPGWGWTSVPVLALAAGAAGAVGLTVRRILRPPHAVIEVGLFHSREFSSAVPARDRGGGALLAVAGKPTPGLRQRVPARDDPRWHGGGAHAGAPVRRRQHARVAPDHHRQRGAQHGPPGRQCGGRGVAGGRAGRRASRPAGAVSPGLDPDPDRRHGGRAQPGAHADGGPARSGDRRWRPAAPSRRPVGWTLEPVMRLDARGAPQRRAGGQARAGSPRSSTSQSCASRSSSPSAPTR